MFTKQSSYKIKVTMKKEKTIIIAEAGVNHDGKLKKAFKLAVAAKKTKANFIKFQAFDPKLLCTVNAAKANYQKKNTNQESQLNMLKKLSLSKQDINKLNIFCKKIRIGLMFSVFDSKSYKIINNLKHEYIKIPSGEINNYPLLKSIKKDKSIIIFSTGLSNLKEIKYCYKILKEKKSVSKIIIMHCNTEYPTPINDVNLRVISNLKKVFKCKIGFSDHSTSTLLPAAAVALGAKYIEKHFTLNQKSKGPDHKASLNPKQFSEMVKNINEVEKSLGSNIKKITNSEKKNLFVVRKSIVAKTKIFKGEKFNINNITTKRPGTGISPINWPKIFGRKSKRNYQEDDLIIYE
jgi:N,N'-diacetyllegionaminate synthase